MSTNETLTRISRHEYCIRLEVSANLAYHRVRLLWLRRCLRSLVIALDRLRLPATAHLLPESAFGHGRTWILVLGLVLTTGFIGLPAQAQPVVRVGSYIQARSTGISEVIKPWVDAVRADVGAQVELQEYWGGVLGKSPHKQFELVQSGILDVTWVLSAYTSGQFPELGLFELPFLFHTAQESSAVGWELYERGLITGFDRVHLIGFFTTEPNQLFLRKSINSLEELSGRKIRSLGAVHAYWLQEFGASAQTMSAVDMNQALARNIIDGVMQGWTGMRTFKSFPLISQSWSIPLGSTSFLLLMNKQTWTQLPVEVQQAMTRHGSRRFAEMGGRAYTKAGDAIRETLRGEGRIEIRVPSAAEQARYRQRTQVVHQWWIDKTPNGQAVYDAAQSILADLRARQPGSID